MDSLKSKTSSKSWPLWFSSQLDVEQWAQVLREIHRRATVMSALNKCGHLNVCSETNVLNVSVSILFQCTNKSSLSRPLKMFTSGSLWVQICCFTRTMKRGGFYDTQRQTGFVTKPAIQRQFVKFYRRAQNKLSGRFAALERSGVFQHNAK